MKSQQAQQRLFEEAIQQFEKVVKEIKAGFAVFDTEELQVKLKIEQEDLTNLKQELESLRSKPN